MKQSRRMTVIESMTGTVVSFVLGVLINMTVLPLLGYPINLTESIGLVIIFTIVSFIRSYFIRRIFSIAKDPWLKVQ